jgi:hypothetical protein
MSNVISFAAFRMRKSARAEAIEHVIRTYRGEIYDWCGHDLACEIAADKLGISERVVRNIINDAGVLF